MCIQSSECLSWVDPSRKKLCGASFLKLTRTVSCWLWMCVALVPDCPVVLCRAPRFKGFQQQDSHELLRHLLDGMKAEEVKVRHHGDGGVCVCVCVCVCVVRLTMERERTPVEIPV